MTDLVKCLDDHAVRTQCSHPDCNACAREFFRWWKTREAQMSNASTGPSFQQAMSSGKFHGMICPTTPSGS